MSHLSVYGCIQQAFSPALGIALDPGNKAIKNGDTPAVVGLCLARGRGEKHSIIQSGVGTEKCFEKNRAE